MIPSRHDPDLNLTLALTLISTSTSTSLDQVEDPSDETKSTAFNHQLMNQLKMADTLIVCGQARSHCVKYTMEDIVTHFDEASKAGLYLLEDGCSSVAGYTQVGEDFLTDMRNKGNF